MKYKIIPNLKKFSFLLIFFPIFFQFRNGLFVERWGVSSGWANYEEGLKPFIYDYNNDYLLLPLPFSIIFSSIIILLNVKRLLKFKNILFIILLNIIFLLFSIFNNLSSLSLENFLLPIQFLIPYLGICSSLILYDKKYCQEYIFEKYLLFFLIIFISLQIYFSFYQWVPSLTPYMYLFSIYQHLQYVPSIFISLFLIVFFKLWQLKNYKIWLILIYPLFFFYAKLSNSLSSLILLLFFFISFFIINLIKKPISIYNLIILVFLLFILNVNNFSFINKVNDFTGKNQTNQITSSSYKIYSKENLNFNNNYIYNGVKKYFLYFKNSRLNKYNDYMEIIKNDKKILLFGLNKNQYFNPHNYYLKIALNHGVIILLPFTLLVFYNFFLIYRLICLKKSSFFFNEFIYFLIILYLIIVECNIKESLLQPYSGICIFFIWGILIKKLLIATKSYEAEN